ncbi:unnamed protein product, partial [Amoebophrya sp. A25]
VNLRSFALACEAGPREIYCWFLRSSPEEKEEVVSMLQEEHNNLPCPLVIARFIQEMMQ